MFTNWKSRAEGPGGQEQGRRGRLGFQLDKGSRKENREPRSTKARQKKTYLLTIPQSTSRAAVYMQQPQQNTLRGASWGHSGSLQPVPSRISGPAEACLSSR